MSPFQIFMRLRSPLIMYKRPPSLASIVWHCLFLHLKSEARAKQRLLELFWQTEGVVHASNLFFVVSTTQTLTATTKTKVGTMRYETDLNERYIKPNGRAGEYTKLLVTGGPYKSRFRQIESYFSPGILFYGYGDITKIHSLLNFYLFGVGADVNSGSGEIDSIRWQSIDKDYSLIGPDGSPSRTIPTRILSRFGDFDISKHVIADTHVSHPYRLGGPIEPCVLDKRIKRIVTK